ncbi:MAG TPA: hypothetical protein VMM77_05680 [Gemmatimonadaceae bacterium]|nr:hypothetical protein [Gemmatimonadaceae bacterium]
MRYSMRWLAGVVLLVGAPLGAQDARLEQRLDAATAARVGAIVDSARAAGLPTRPLTSKALEGASKGAPGARIIAAVSRLAQGLRSARDVLGPSTDAELDAAASALMLGVRAEEVAAVRGARSGERLTVPLAVLADLVAYGVPSDAATQAVVQLAGRSEDEALLDFRRDVERDIALGAPPAAAAAVRLNSAGRLESDLTTQQIGIPPPKPRKP